MSRGSFVGRPRNGSSGGTGRSPAWKFLRRIPHTPSQDLERETIPHCGRLQRLLIQSWHLSASSHVPGGISRTLLCRSRQCSPISHSCIHIMDRFSCVSIGNYIVTVLVFGFAIARGGSCLEKVAARRRPHPLGLGPAEPPPRDLPGPAVPHAPGENTQTPREL